MDNKAIVKETGEIVTTKNQFQTRYLKFSFEFDLGDVVKDNIEKTFVHPGTGETTTDREGNYYTCDNGKTYHESEVIVGLGEIREYKLKNNLEI